MRVWAWRLAVGLVIVACGGPPRPPSRVVKFESEVHSATLDNGIRVLVAQDTSTNLVEVGVRFDVGSASDPEGRAGLAHLVEHLMFQVRSDDHPIAADMAAVAIGFNAYTSWDSTHYMTTARADQLARVLELEALRFGQSCSTIPEATFEREREVVRNELRLRSGGIFADFFQFILEQVYPKGHPYQRAVIGDDEQLSALTLQDACDFVDAHYRPDRMVVVVSGNVEARAATGLVAQHLGVLTGISTTSLPAFPAPRAAGRTVRRDMATDFPALVISWPMPPEHSDLFPAAAIAVDLVVRDLTRSAGQFAFTMQVGGARAPVALMVLPFVDSASDVDDALQAVWKAVERTEDYRGGIALEHLVNGSAQSLLTRFDALWSRVNGFADTMQFAPDRHFFAHRLETLDTLIAEDVANAATSVLAKDRATIVIVEPSDDDGSPLEQSTLSYRGQSHEADEWKAPIDAAEATRALDIPITPSMLDSAEQFELENGLRVIMLRTSSAPVMSVRLVFFGGSADDPEEKTGLALLSAKLLEYQSIDTRGDDTAVYEALYRFGSSVHVDVDADHTVFSVDGLSSHMDAMLAGISGLVHDGRYYDRTLKKWRESSDKKSRTKKKKGTKTRRQKKAEKQTEARREYRLALYQATYGDDHPYAREDDRLRLDAKNISLEDMKAHRQRHFNASNGILIITGQYDVDLTKEHVKYRFDDLRGGEVFDLERPEPAPRTSRVIASVASDDSAPTTTIDVAYPVPANDERVAERLVLARIVNERVSRVRHTLGAAYAVSARQVVNAGPGMLRITAFVDSKRADEALVAITGELAALREPGVDLSEAFARARREVLKGLLADESGARQSASRIVAIAKKGDELTYYTSLAKRVMNLTVDDLMPILREELSVDREFIGLYGPEASIELAIEQAGLQDS